MNLTCKHLVRCLAEAKHKSSMEELPLKHASQSTHAGIVTQLDTLLK